MIVPFRTWVNGPRLLAETVGTFMLVVIGPGAAAVNLHTNGAMSHVGVALSFAFVILAGLYAFGHIGAHSNPTVASGFWLSARVPAGGGDSLHPGSADWSDGRRPPARF